MDGSVLDALQGKHYDLDTFENEVIKVESAGSVIRVAIKNDAGQLFSWWEPTHPFAAGRDNLPKQGKWSFCTETPNENETHAVFTNGSERHVLCLRVTDPSMTPKPVEVSWN